MQRGGYRIRRVLLSMDDPNIESLDLVRGGHGRQNGNRLVDLFRGG
jgi:hypothetical protein